MRVAADAVRRRDAGSATRPKQEDGNPGSGNLGSRGAEQGPAGPVFTVGGCRRVQRRRRGRARAGGDRCRRAERGAGRDSACGVAGPPPVRLGAASARSSPVPVLRRAGVSPRAPGGGGEPRAARPRADAAAARSRSAPHAPPLAGAERGRRARSHAAPPAPALRPLFLWASQRDGTVQRVRCEDYDPRNRIYLTRTPAGWRAFPKTDTFDAIRRGTTRPSPPPPSPPPPPKPRERDCRGRRRRRARPPRRRPRVPSPAWLAPDLESHIPSHTITIPRVPTLTTPSSPRPPESPPSTPASACSPSPLPPANTPPPELTTAPSPGPAPVSPPPAPTIPPQPPEPTPLDSLLAVAELEFNQQRGSEALELELRGEIGSGARFAFLPPEEPVPVPASIGMAFSLGAGAEEALRDELGAHEDLFESISAAHYLPELGGPHDEALLESLVEKGCEDNQILGRIDRLAAQLQHAAEFEEHVLLAAPAVPDIIERLETLESPSRSAAQGLLHLARRTSVAETFVPDEVFAQEQRSPPRAATPSEGQRQHMDLYTEQVPGLQETFDYEEYGAIAGPSERAQAESATPPEVPPLVRPEPEPIADIKPEEDVDLKILLTGDITDIDFKLADPVPENDLNKEEPHEPGEASTSRSPVHEDERARPPATAERPKADSQNGPKDRCEELPRDLSMRTSRRLSTPHASPRALSIGSDSMQSPQPSGIPVMSSPEAFNTPTNKNKPQSFLDALYASSSPKMYTSEVTITKQNFDATTTGKHRKSISPSVNGSDDIRNTKKDSGEPQEKRRREGNDLAKICNLLKKCGENKQAEAKQKKSANKPNEMEQMTPKQQLELLKSNKNFNLPDPLMIPKDRFRDVVSAPGTEIPALLISRPDLNLPEIIRNLHSVNDPNVLVLSLKQLTDIVDPKVDAASIPEGSKEKNAKENAKESTHTKSTSKNTEHNKSSSSEHIQTRTSSTPQPQPDQSSQRPASAVGQLAEDIDAANSAAAYQMFWLPAYLSHLSHLEATALSACSQNPDFVKALQSSGGYGGPGYANLTQMFHQSRLMSPPNFPMLPPVDYDRGMQLAMWQEAMAAAARQKQSERSGSGAEASRKEATPPAPDFQNPYAHFGKSHQSKSHSSARTSPIAINYTNNQRMLAHSHLMQNMYPGISPNLRHNAPLPNLQIPFYNPSGSQRSPRTSQQKSPTSPYFPNNNYLHAAKQPDAYQQRCGSGGSGQGSPRPRISVKSLQELQHAARRGAAAGPLALPAPPVRRREEPEVCSTAGAAAAAAAAAAADLPLMPPHMPPHPHDPAAFPIWNPLYTNQKGYTSPWSWTTVTATGD